MLAVKLPIVAPMLKVRKHITVAYNLSGTQKSGDDGLISTIKSRFINVIIQHKTNYIKVIIPD